MLPIMNEVATELVDEVYPDYKQHYAKIFVRIKELPVEDKLRDLRQVHLNALIKIRGVVTKRTGVFPELTEMYFRCNQCGDIKGPVIHQNNQDPKQFLGKCHRCQAQNQQYSLEQSKCLFRNY